MQAIIQGEEKWKTIMTVVVVVVVAAVVVVVVKVEVVLVEMKQEQGLRQEGKAGKRPPIQTKRGGQMTTTTSTPTRTKTIITAA